MTFSLVSDFSPAGDQPKAIDALYEGITKGYPAQTLLGATGTGKTFTIANVIARLGKPTLVIAHNKTLAAQLAQEFKSFFPNNAVHYFVSYYDYYQPEAYVPTSDTYIEKDAQINKEIDRLRHATTQSLLTRKDVIIVASVSCIYGLGSPVEYQKVNMILSVGVPYTREALLKQLVTIHFTRTTADLTPGTFRAIGNTIEIMPVSESLVYRLTLDRGTIESIFEIDPVSMRIIRTPDVITIFPAKHFITDPLEKERAITAISKELQMQLAYFEKEGKVLEAERLKRRTTYDLAMMREMGYCNGIENYSRHLSGKLPGEAPDTLLSYFPHHPDGTPDFLTIIDESHVTLPQLSGMHAGDASRKNTLVEYGFRLPSAKDNRPLRYEEFKERIGQVVYVSATPGPQEREVSHQIVEQLIRPTGLLDPELIVRPIVPKGVYQGQIADFITETEKAISRGGRVLATTLTKKMAEDLSVYIKERGIKAEYLHSDIKTIDRIRILTNFRKGIFDCLIGVNLLREGLDLPEVSLIGILDADKEGFLRSETSLIQTIGRAARNSEGKVLLYAEVMTGSLSRAIEETNRRREIQKAYNKKHGITPATILKRIEDITDSIETDRKEAARLAAATDTEVFGGNIKKLLQVKEKEMKAAVKALDFETAAVLRDEIQALKETI